MQESRGVTKRYTKQYAVAGQRQAKRHPKNVYEEKQNRPLFRNNNYYYYLETIIIFGYTSHEQSAASVKQQGKRHSEVRWIVRTGEPVINHRNVIADRATRSLKLQKNPDCRVAHLPAMTHAWTMYQAVNNQLFRKGPLMNRNVIFSITFILMLFFAPVAYAEWGKCMLCHNGIIAPGKGALKEKFKTADEFLHAAISSKSNMMKSTKNDKAAIQQAIKDIGL